MPELPPVTMAFWPLRTLLIGQAGITGSGNCSSINFRSGVCIRPIGIIAGLGFSKNISVEFMLFPVLFVLLGVFGFLLWSREFDLPYKRGDAGLVGPIIVSSDPSRRLTVVAGKSGETA